MTEMVFILSLGFPLSQTKLPALIKAGPQLLFWGIDMKTFHGISRRHYGLKYYKRYHAILVRTLNYAMAWLGLFDAMVGLFSFDFFFARTQYDFMLWLAEHERAWEKAHENNS